MHDPWDVLLSDFQFRAIHHIAYLCCEKLTPKGLAKWWKKHGALHLSLRVMWQEATAIDRSSYFPSKEVFDSGVEVLIVAQVCIDASGFRRQSLGAFGQPGWHYPSKPCCPRSRWAIVGTTSKLFWHYPYARIYLYLLESDRHDSDDSWSWSVGTSLYISCSKISTLFWATFQIGLLKTMNSRREIKSMTKKEIVDVTAFNTDCRGKRRR